MFYVVALVKINVINIILAVALYMSLFLKILCQLAKKRNTILLNLA